MMSHGACSLGQTYAASKYFVDFMAHALGYELSEFGVDVCCWRAAGVSTKLIADYHDNNSVVEKYLTATP